MENAEFRSQNVEVRIQNLNVEVGSMSENTILHHSDLGVRYSDFKFEYLMLNAECRILKLGVLIVTVF